MDLESESSALESVGDNGLIQKSAINISHDGRSFDNGSCSDESVKLASTSTVRTSTKDEKSVEFGKPMSFDSSGGATSPISKGQGLRKWRRVRRELVKDTPVNRENSKALKRGLSGIAHSHGKQMQFQSPEVEQDSQGSVGSVNILKCTSGGFDIPRTGYDSTFVAGVGFSASMDPGKDDDRSSKSSTAARVPKFIRNEKPLISSGQRGKSRVEYSKKHRGESAERERESSYSSLESDSRKQSGRMMDYNGENGYEANMNGENSILKDKAGGEGEKSNNRYSEEFNPLKEAIDCFLTVQEALEKEVQQFQEMAKDPMPQHHEGTSEVNSPHSEIVSLVNNVEQLKIKLEETMSLLEVKESYIQELESTTNQKQHLLGGTETVVEDIFLQRNEAEIEYLIYSRSVENLKSQMKLIEEQEALAGEQSHKMLNKLEEVETKAANLANKAQDLQKECIETTGTIKKRACTTTSYLLIQVVLLLTVVLLFMSQLFPESENVVPT